MTSTPRFTLDGTAALESHLARTCEAVRAGVQALVPASALDGLALGGGYGRGEGGVWRTPEGDRPYNDLEFYVFVRGQALLAERKYRGPLHALGERLSPEAGLEVEFKVLTLAKLRRSPPSMFYYDLVLGHRWLVGDDALLGGCAQHREPGRIPLHEATRLLMNRCSGLLFALERLGRPSFGAEDADFVGRNLAKAQLAFGDAVLAAQGQYHWSCRERHERLLRLEAPDGLPLDDLRRHHAAGVEFKLHPVRSVESRDTLRPRHAELGHLGRRLWLWLESRRLGSPFGSPRAYARAPADLCPETSAWRNRLVTLRAFGPAEALGPRGARYPRERLLRALCLLLWRDDADAAAGGGRVAEDLAQVHRALCCRGSTLDLLVPAYARVWSRFN